jgi:tetratricopeptide (TPR) repeat protein
MPTPPSSDLGAKSRQVLERIIMRLTSIRGGGISCGGSQMWLWRQIRQNKGVDLVKVSRALGSLGLPGRVYLEEVFDVLPHYDPVWLLEHFSPRRGELDPFLATLQERFRRLLEHPLTPFAAVSRRQREIEALEEKCHSDRQAGKAGLEILGRELLVSAEAARAGDRGLARGHLADCARLLLVWGEVRRSAGCLGDGIAALELAYRLGLAAKDAAVLGLFFHDGAEILSRLGQFGHALRFAHGAARHFQVLRDGRFLPLALIQLSLICEHQGQHTEARLQAIAALRLSSRDQWRIRPAAWAQLAKLAKTRGATRRAFALLERAKKNKPAEELKAFIRGRQAVWLAQLGRVRKAARSFSDAMWYFKKHGRHYEIAVFAIDLAEALVTQRRFAAILELVQVTTPRFEQLNGDQQALALWMDLCALILDGKRDQCREQVARVREALARPDEAAFSSLGSVPAGLLL